MEGITTMREACMEEITMRAACVEGITLRRKKYDNSRHPRPIRMSQDNSIGTTLLMF
jgi:hypothetical protein